MADRIEGRAVPWTAVAILLPGILVSLATISAVDLAYGIRVGREMLGGTGIPRSDTFTFTAAGAPWVDQQWLAHLLFGALHLAGGWPLLATFWAFTAVAISALVLYAAWVVGADRRSAAIVWLFGFTIAAPAIGLRAQALGLLCLAVLLAIVLGRDRHPNGLWWSVPVVAAWANLHGSFPIGLALLAVASIEDVTAHRPGARRTALVTFMAVASTLVNPYGIGVWSYVAAIGTDPTVARFVVEWQHTLPTAPAGAAYYAAVVATAGLVVLAARRGWRLSWPAVLWLGGLAMMGAWAFRAVAWFGVGAAPLIAGLVATVRPHHPDEVPQPITRGRVSRVASLSVAAMLDPGWRRICADAGGELFARLPRPGHSASLLAMPAVPTAAARPVIVLGPSTGWGES